MLAALPTRTREAIRAKCRYPQEHRERHIWKGREIALLRKLYAKGDWGELRKAFPFASDAMVRAAAKTNGIQGAKSYKLSGLHLIDELRERCLLMEISMPMLDTMSGTGRYFTRSGWLGAKPNYKAIDKAIKALGGEISIEWEPLD
jgi:hypothetical protein